LRLYEAPLVLIRPDQIVAWRGTDAQDAARILALVTGRGAPAGGFESPRGRRSR